MCIYIYIYIHVCMYIYIYICICAYVHTCSGIRHTPGAPPTRGVNKLTLLLNMTFNFTIRATLMIQIMQE